MVGKSKTLAAEGALSGELLPFEASELSRQAEQVCADAKQLVQRVTSCPTMPVSSHKAFCLQVQRGLEEAEKPFYEALEVAKRLRSILPENAEAGMYVVELLAALRKSEAPWDAVMDQLMGITGRGRQ